MSFSDLENLSMDELLERSQELDAHIATLQTGEGHTSQQKQKADSSREYIILGAYTGEAYTVQFREVTPGGRYVFWLKTPYGGDGILGRKWRRNEVMARSLGRVHTKAERKIQKRDKLRHKELQAEAWIQQRI